MRTRNYENQIREKARRELIEEQVCFVIYHVIVISTIMFCLFW